MAKCWKSKSAKRKSNNRLREGESLVIHHETEEIRFTRENSGSPTYRRLTASADGKLQVRQLVFYRGYGECKASRWVVPRPISTP